MKVPPLPSISVEQRDHDTIILRSPLKLGHVEKSLAHIFDRITAIDPSAIFMKQRCPSGEWRSISYGEAQSAANALAQWLINHGIEKGDCVAFLSGPSIEHGIAAIGIQRSGGAIAPISPAYSLNSTDHSQLRQCIDAIKPKAIIVDDASAYAPAIAAIKDICSLIIAVEKSDNSAQMTRWSDVVSTAITSDVARRMEQIEAADLARVIYTSGSTGAPKATPQSHANLTITVAQCEALNLLDFGGERPQLLEAMPFSHIMAGNFNFNNIIAAGGTIWLDDGKPTPHLFDKTVRNLYDVSPHYIISVPLGLSMLCDACEADAALRDRVFAKLKFIGFGGALLSGDVKSRIEALAGQVRSGSIPVYSFYGATEYLFGCLKYWEGGSADTIGLPLPATEMKLVSIGDRYEMRIKSPTCMPRSGYLGQDQPIDGLFDEDGFFKTGDSVRFADAADPKLGLVFAGRLSEDFKLSSGTYVQVENLRQNLLSACPTMISDAVICGLNAPYPSALVWLKSVDLEEAKKSLSAIIPTFNQRQGGSARQIGAIYIVDEPPSFDAGEVTVKGNLAQRVVRERRADKVRLIYDGENDARLIRFDLL